MPEKRRVIVILSVSAGSGHMRAAGAMRSALLEDDPRCEVIILDTFKYTTPFLERLILGTYMDMLKYTPAVYGYIYSRSEKGQPLSGYAKTEFNKLLSRFSAGKLLRFIKQHSPEVVICTHPFPLGVLSAICNGGEFGCFTVAAVTDFIIHPFWVFPEVDLYLVGAPELAGDLVSCGISPQRVEAAGIPIDPVFTLPVNREEVLRRYGLDPGLTTILVMGGGLGMGPLPESVMALGSLDPCCQIVIVTGSNVRLKKKIEQMAPGLTNTVCPLGYVHNVHELMASSDILVSKAGGLSCAEALATGIPMFILDPLPGQECRNSQFLTSAGAAVAVEGARDLVEKIAAYMKEPALLKKMSRDASRMGRPDAARTAVRLINSRLKDGFAANASTGFEYQMEKQVNLKSDHNFLQ